MTTEEEDKVVVFWDVVECPLPDDLEPSEVSENIESALDRQGYLPCNVSIRVYGKKNHEFKDEFLLANIMFVPAGDANARYNRMVKDIDKWALDNDESDLMVISRVNSKFATYLADWKAKDLFIFGAEPEKAPGKCSNCKVTSLDELFTQQWVWESLSLGGDPITRA
ncbi:NYN domain limkain-b1-type [Arabidopsis suecica]|uniref:NYN domain limkain-b1-type n=1 Tax=Arabidopsis suecica TaxID=45249 RepID=A0A8T2FGQ6_ARASU|nr:NYN domain limkain-b1-type [Arabidopsis suecica]